MYLNKSK